MSYKKNNFLNIMSKKNIFTIVLIIFAILGIYYPSVVFDFLYSDDYLYFFPKITDTRYDDYLSSNLASLREYSMAIGRPFLFYFILLGNNLIDKIGDAAIFRVFAILGLTVFSIMTYVWLRINGRNALNAFFIVILIISTPSMVLSVSWITMHLAIYSMLLSIFAIFVVHRGLNSNSWIHYLLAFFIMLISLNGYSPYSMMYWCLVLIKATNIKSLDINDYKLKLLPFFIVGFSSMAGYFILGKLIFEFGGGLEGNPISKIFWLIREPILYALSFNTLFPNLFIVMGTLLVIFYGVFYGFINIYIKDGSLKFNNLFVKIESLKISIILGLLFLSFSPIILAVYSVNSHRILLVLKSSLIIIFIYGLEKIVQNSKLRLNVIPLILIITTPIVIYHAHNINKNYMAAPQHDEYLYLKNELDLNLTEDINYIHLYRPPWWTGNVPYDIPEGFDIGVFSSSVASNAKNMIISVLYDLEFRDQNTNKASLFNKKYVISSSVRGSEVRSSKDGLGEPPPRQNVLIVDMFDYVNSIKTNNFEN